MTIWNKFKKLFSNNAEQENYLSNLNYIGNFITDTATLSILDPSINRLPIETDKENTDDDWWIDFTKQCPLELKNGEATFLNLAADGSYRIRITGKNELTNLEQKYQVSMITNIGVKITSGHCHIGGAEYVTSSSISDCQDTICVRMTHGEYNLIVYGIRGSGKDFQAVYDQLPDIVLVILPRVQPFQFLSSDQVVFPDIDTGQRFQSNFSVGDYLKSGVKLNHQHQLYLNYAPTNIIHLNQWPESRNDWPFDYQVVLNDMTNLESMDYIVIRIDAINEDSKVITCSLIKKLENVRRSY